MSEYEQFNLENQFIKYLNLVGLKLDQMHPQQILETKRAFYGACGQMLVLMTVELPKLSDNAAESQILALQEQISNYWRSQN